MYELLKEPRQLNIIAPWWTKFLLPFCRMHKYAEEDQYGNKAIVSFKKLFGRVYCVNETWEKQFGES
jgi:hypothetical protein